MLSYVSMFVMTLVYIIISKTYTATWGGESPKTEMRARNVDALSYFIRMELAVST